MVGNVQTNGKKMEDIPKKSMWKHFQVEGEWYPNE